MLKGKEKTGVEVGRTPPKIKLHVGCGNRRLDGYTNIDIRETEATDKVMDIRALGKDYEKETIEEIRSHHLFEHFSRVDALAVLAQWTILIKQYGKIMIEVPDLEGSAENFMKNPSLDNRMCQIRHLVGDQSQSWAFHRDLWYKGRFDETLPLFGYSNIRYLQSKWPHYPHLANLTVVAEKINERSWEQLREAGQILLKQSMVDKEKEKETYEKWTREFRRVLDRGKKTGIMRINNPLQTKLPDNKFEKSTEPKSS